MGLGTHGISIGKNTSSSSNYTTTGIYNTPGTNNTFIGSLSGTSSYSVALKPNLSQCIKELNQWVKTRSWGKSFNNVFYHKIGGNTINCDWDSIKHVSDDKMKLIDRIQTMLLTNDVYNIMIGDSYFHYTPNTKKWNEIPKYNTTSSTSFVLGSTNTTSLTQNVTSPVTFTHDTITLTSKNKTLFDLKIFDDGTLQVIDNFTQNVISEIPSTLNKEKTDTKKDNSIPLKERIKLWLIKQVNKI